ncbi:hypothetical protein B0G80_7361 [Paraburkholderia sp. BL6669N2]|nr:hypothetical protein B0G80_7361 [Paraburkholderia sp. BL6669N2]
MNGIDVTETRPAPYAIGRLEPLQSLKYKPKCADGLPDNFPVLTIPIEEPEVDLFRIENARIGFSFSIIEWGEVLVHCFRLQVEDTQVFWLTDVTDSEIWEAMDQWLRAKSVLVHFKVQGQWAIDERSFIMKPEFIEENPYAEFQHRSAPQANVAWDHMLDIAECGFLILAAESDDEALPLRRVYQNLLRTKRFEQFVDDGVLIFGKTGDDNLVARKSNF